MKPLVSVIIPVHNDARQLDRCLSALDEQTFTEPFEVLVVDNGSTDDPGAVVAEHPRAQLLVEPRLSSYAARNRGVRHARGEAFAFVDSDCIPAKDWLARGYETLVAEEDPVFVGGRVPTFPAVPDAPTPTERWEAIHAFPQRDYIEQHRWSGAGNLFVRADVFHAVGRFADSVISSGDREWGQRASAAGVRGVYADDVVAFHPARRSFAQVHRKLRRLQEGQAQVRRLKGEPLIGWYLLRRLVPPVPTILRNLGHPSHDGLLARLQYAGYVLMVHYVGEYERLRVVFSRRQRRERTATHRSAPRTPPA